ncbi:TIGR04219 family outer membrane beta-barrel protein [Vibrio gallicus]|uniref:TIGR04219 family outer membrane beta-barrel protein n=1 Tax=Vibrio gallicus TaxID=190897 RepID=UPI0021C3FBF8|nr:TIGR04219 family outer membrane beta-barrel protein [Vibrio gallicus]
MNKCTLVTVVSVSALAMPISAQAQPEDYGLQGSVTADVFWGSTKIKETRKEDDTIPSFSASIEHDVPYLPNFRLRYTKLDTPDIAHDKYDYTFYYRPLRTDNLALDLGFTLSDYRNSFYRYDATESGDFDSTIFSWYANALIAVPNSNFAVIGEFDFGETSKIKSADMTAGIQYRIECDSIDVIFRGGYRVLDYTFKEYDKKAYGFVDGWFLGSKITF